ncbi:2-isopropylmalate synthase [Micromonospora sp. NPDC023814]|uniref:2-isopropylmalate synthase n=1 Tax=Micromonospora sp. NPDC023814 TaxID=3154596 RepID=UPI0033F463DF
MAKATFPVGQVRQRASRLPYRRYAPAPAVDLADRSWPAKRITTAPRWLSTDLRDGNQALPHPMDVDRKARLFRLLVAMGYKEIEIGFPAASRTEFEFTRRIIENGEIPDDVLIQAIVPAREELIRRTFDALAGAPQAIVHLYNSTSPTQRRVVFRADRGGVLRLAVDHARLCRELADAHPGRIGFEYSPESFSQTELDFALDVCAQVTDVWDPADDREIIINLPATVECAGPHVFADQVEWMSRNLPRREHVCLSLHPHNDRGTGVAAAELGLLAGGQRIEGCLFGNGERTGNVCLVVLGLNLMSQGVDPQIDLSDIDAVRHEVEQCTGMRVPERYPYAGDLVHTSFSGSHQDAISKGLRALSEDAADRGVALSQHRWDVPYLPIDPKDIGRSYEAIIRLNSQSGKGGVEYLLRSCHGLNLPRSLQIEVSGLSQAVSDDEGREVTAEELWSVFRAEFLPAALDVQLVSCELSAGAPGPGAVKVELAVCGGPLVVGGDAGHGLLPSIARALAQSGPAPVVLDHAEQPFTLDEERGTLAYVRCRVDGRAVWGCGFDPDPTSASLRGLCVALHRAGWRPSAVLPSAQPSQG